MARTVSKFTRMYQDGYDLSADVETTGELGVEYEHEDRACLSWGVKGGLNGVASLSFGPVNGVFNSDTAGWHSVITPGTNKVVMVPIGESAAPAAGCPVFGGVFELKSYKRAEGVMVPFTAAYNSTAGAQAYDIPWGKLLHAKGSETAANTGGGVDFGAAGTGGWLMYQIFSITGAGTVTISIDDSTNDSTYGALSGATSGAIATASAPCAGIVELAKTASTKQYMRWQIAFGGSATACVFALAYFRK